MLLDAEPRGNKPAVSREAPIVLSGQNVTIDYTIPGGFLSKSSKFRAVDGVNVNLHQGQTIGIVGESGSGKSTLGRALLLLIQADGRIFSENRKSPGLIERPCGRYGGISSSCSRTPMVRFRRDRQ